MSLRPDGIYRCDRCGLELENGGVHECAAISTVDRDDPNRVVQFHLCRAPREGAPRGCEGNVLGAGTLADYTETRTPPA